MKKLFWTIGEVAGQLGESVPLVRSWTNEFSDLVSPRRNAKGNRLYTADDLETLRKIHYLVRIKGITLNGAHRLLLSGEASVDNRVKVLERLKNIRARLEEIKNIS